MYYYFKNPDVAAAKMDPLRTISNTGLVKAANPNPYFDTAYYLANNPDVAASGMNPLEHYDRVWLEGRAKSFGQLRHEGLSRRQSGRGSVRRGSPAHFLQYGLYEGRDPMGGTTATA